MDRMRAIIFSAIAVAAVVSASISLSYVGLNNGALPPAPGNNTATPPVQNNETSVSSENDTFKVLPDTNPPKILDSSLKVEKVISGLALPTSMQFVGRDDILILQKENGRVRLVSDGALQPNPIFDTFVEKNSERGLLGVAVENTTGESKAVFLYYTEPDGNEIRNRVYKYDWNGTGNLTGGALVLDLPGEPGPNHDGGKLKIGPDGLLYAVIGDLNRNGMLQNYKTGPEPDNTSSILRVDLDGKAVNGTQYYAYGIRNSFGLEFDPLTGVLWDTENGPDGYDEINVVKQGFNSGWETVMGPIDRRGVDPNSLVKLDNNSHYQDPVFSWRQSQGLTDIEFLNSTNLGDKYANNIFVGDINNGNLYFFKVNSDRTGLELGAGVDDFVADSAGEVDAVKFGMGFAGGITDIETGPDGYLYILTFGGNLYRIVPAG